MNKQNYSLLNVLAGLRIDIKAKSLADASGIAVQLMFDKNGEWDAEESISVDGEKIHHLSGINKETGKKVFIIVMRTEYANKKEEFSTFEIVN